MSLSPSATPEFWSVFQLVATGRGEVDDLLTTEEMEELFRRLARLSVTAPYDIKPRCCSKG